MIKGIEDIKMSIQNNENVYLRSELDNFMLFDESYKNISIEEVKT